MSRPVGVVESLSLTLNCAVCRMPFLARRATARYCSPSCRDLNRRRLVFDRRECEFCGASFLPFEATTRFCSRSCRSRGLGPIVGAKNSVALFGKGTKGPVYRDSRSGRWIVVGRDGRNYLWYRILMENHLGRELATEEAVHHINGDQGDDRLENLTVLSRSEHARLHAVARYGAAA